MKKIFKLAIYLSFGLIITSNAQVKISDTGSTSPGANSLLELESTTKGFLPPRMAINSLTSALPLTAPVTAGMLVYSSGGTVTDGYYYWNGSNWVGVGGSNVISKSATGAIAKNETFILASGNITLTLPAVTAADNGLTITVKNVGTYTDLVTVVGNGGATIDGVTSSFHTRWVGNTYIVNGTNWVIKDRVNKPDDLYDVSSTSSWTTIPEIIAYLNLHMTAPSVVRLGGETFTLTSTQTINLPFPVSFQGLTYGVTTISPASAFTGGLFSCTTECYFKFIGFNSTFGATSGHDAIRLTNTGTYHEIKDCVFNGFNKGISVQSNNDLWVFECDFQDDVTSGIDVNGAVSGVSVKVSESDFTNCGSGINLVSGSNATISVQSCGFYPAGGHVGLTYVPATFTTVSDMFFTNNVWDNTGTFVSGFDFTRTDGRDANIDIENNAGIENKNPKCKINVINNATTVTCANTATWYKPTWTNTSFYTINWSISAAAASGNRFTFLPTNTRDIFIIFAGDLSVNGSNRTINVAIVKNGVTTTRYGETTLRVTSANQPFQFSTTIYIPGVVKNDYFEIWVNDSSNGGDVVTFQDVNVFVNAQ